MVTQHERIPVTSLAMTTRMDSMSRLFELTLGDVRLSREFPLSCLAQLKSALQTNRYWRDLGAYPTNPQHGWFSLRRFGFLPGDGGNGRHGQPKNTVHAMRTYDDHSKQAQSPIIITPHSTRDRYGAGAVIEISN
jgi:hypothetical protein